MCYISSEVYSNPDIDTVRRIAAVKSRYMWGLPLLSSDVFYPYLPIRVYRKDRSNIVMVGDDDLLRYALCRPT